MLIQKCHITCLDNVHFSHSLLAKSVAGRCIFEISALPNGLLLVY
ncbi:unnamed protein product [Toxocara canis]|uniref:ABC transporter ATP-binding protein n=1 Tax=Toxocara canis TaxID=6265 RepID=A0A183UC66_TOXCA|nr:unnamed protein product [Toxocara canis]